MIDRFNFYDVYGYLVPGLAILGLAWLPFALLSHSFPQNELLSAVAVLAFGYVVGHLLQNIATNALPSQFADERGNQRRPSDLLLDSSNRSFTDDVKRNIGGKVKDCFSIDLSNGRDGEEALSRSRNQAFLMARGVLIKEELVTYAEQFEGLYAMMRGMSAACFLGSLYFFCWGLAIFKNQCLWRTAVILCWAALVTPIVVALIRNARPVDDSQRYRLDKVTLGSMALAVSSGGYLLAFHRISSVAYAKVFFIVGSICLFLMLRFYLEYRHFAFEFARVVWREFAARQAAK